MKNQIILLALAFNLFLAKSQVTFDHNFPGYIARSILPLDDGSYLFTGEKNNKFYLGRLDEKGKKILWNKLFSGNNGRKIIRTKDKNFIAAGEYASGLNSDYYIVKFDSLGNIIFEKQYKLTNHDGANSIVETSNGDFWIVGYSLGSKNANLLKISSNGDSITRKIIHSSQTIYFRDIIRTFDNNYMVAGKDSNKAALVKISEAGDSLWGRRYAQPYAIVSSIIQTPDSGFIAASDGSIFKVSKTGDFLWKKGALDFGYWESADGVMFNKVIKTADGNYMTTGADVYDGFSYQFKTILAKFNINGDTMWTKELNNPEFSYNEGLGLQQTKDSGYIICGDSWNDDTCVFNFIKTDKFGRIIKLTTPSICLITLDATTEKNKIVWERPSTGGIEKYIVYRMDGAAWKALGEVPFNNVSQFVDSTSQPSATHYKYSLVAINSNGDSSARSPYIETILLQSNTGTTGKANMSWNPYSDESKNFIPEYYYIYRGKAKTSFALIDSISGNTTMPSYTDNNYDGTEPYYQVGFKKQACKPASILKGETGPYTQSLSNIIEYKVLKNKSSDALSATVFPNPFAENFSVSYALEDASDVTIQIVDVLGRVVSEKLLNAQNAGINLVELNAENVPEGTNYIKIISKDKISIIKCNRIK